MSDIIRNPALEPLARQLFARGLTLLATRPGAESVVAGLSSEGWKVQIKEASGVGRSDVLKWLRPRAEGLEAAAWVGAERRLDADAFRGFIGWILGRYDLRDELIADAERLAEMARALGATGPIEAMEEVHALFARLQP